MGSRLRLSSGRLIAVGRLLLAVLLLLVTRLDPSQPARTEIATYLLLGSYIAFAAVLLVATWRNWWLDAKLSGPAHALDVAVFTLLVLVSESYTSPFFILFVFLLLAAAIRWSWHATLLIALLLTLLYLLAGMILSRSDVGLELQPLFVRTGQLGILSLILIWFGANQWRAHYAASDDGLTAHPSLDESPIDSALRTAIERVRASGGIFVWRGQEHGQFAGTRASDGDSAAVAVPGHALAEAVKTTPFLYNARRDRCLKTDPDGNLVDFALSGLIAARTIAALDLSEGLAVPVRSEHGQGELFLEGVRGLSTDHIDMAERIAEDVATHIRRHALLRAVDENAEARSRLSLARDLHDSIVQFLAGSAFRLEAMKRSLSAGREVETDLDELKQLMLHEQRELRAFITVLRGGSQVAFEDFAADLSALANRLSSQWNVNCEVTVKPADVIIPMRLHLDTHQLMREAVANAVRHAAATTVRVSVEAEPDRLNLKFLNNGTALREHGGRLEAPGSLAERVAQAGGEIDVARGMDVTRLAISLPIRGERR